MIGKRFNFEDVFFRDLTVCVLDTLEGQVRWVNRFSSGDVSVNVPFYYSLTGDEKFLLDSFQDDVVSNNRFVELNTDIIPRGHLTMTGFNIRSDEFANPNVWLRMVVENEKEIRKILARVRAIPITVNYELTIVLESEIDTFKCAQAIMDTLWIYKFMYFEHNFMNIDAVILMPDTNQIEMSREKNLTSDNSIRLKASFEVSTYYPAFRKDRVGAPGYINETGSGQSDDTGIVRDIPPYPPIATNGIRRTPISPFAPWQSTLGGREWGGFTYSLTGGGGGGGGGGTDSSRVYQGGPFGLTSSWSDTISTGDPFGQRRAIQIPFIQPGGNANVSAQAAVNSGRFVDDPDYYLIAPKRTKWFNNILKAREKAAMPINNPNGTPPNVPNPNANPPVNPNQ
jgi:hypothetical protein